MGWNLGHYYERFQKAINRLIRRGRKWVSVKIMRRELGIEGRERSMIQFIAQYLNELHSRNVIAVVNENHPKKYRLPEENVPTIRKKR